MAEYCTNVRCYEYQPCPKHDIIFERSVASQTLGGETILFEEKFVGELRGWNWVREDQTGWRLEDQALFIKTKAGGIWGNFFNDNLASNFLLRPSPDGCTAFEVSVKLEPRSYGEQAGLFWMHDDNNYVKLVVEGMKDGSVALVLAREVKGEAAVVNKVPLGADVSPSIRLELSPDGTKISGLLDTGYCMRLVGSCDVSELQGSPLFLGLGAHGAKPEGSNWARFSSFRCLRIAANRIQFGAPVQSSTENKTGGIEAEGEEEEEILYAPEPPQPGGWVFSSALSPEEKLKIQGMLAAQGLPTA